MTGDLIELGLSKGRGAVIVEDERQTMVWLVRQLLGVIAELPVRADSTPQSEERARLERSRTRLSRTLHSPLSGQAAEECLRSARDYLDGVAVCLNGREAELNEAIGVLRGVVAELASEAGEFRRKLEDSTGRLGSLSEIRDLAELKRLLSQEVGRIKCALAEKKQGEEEARRRMSEQIEGLRTRLARVEEAASLDAMTGVANRGSFDAVLGHWIGRACVAGRIFSLALVDLDDFKRINDEHGHPAGDFALKHVAQFLKRNVRSTDFVARYGGEEFALLLEGSTLRDACVKMERVLARLAAEPLNVSVAGREVGLMLTASCGLAECGVEEGQWELVMRADGALYDAKRAGKNRVVTTW